jgi:hypothetical protein
MPGSGSPAYAQGSTVSFNGDVIGSILNWVTRPASASTTDTTGVDNAIWGSGDQSRLLKTVACTTVDPGTASVRLLGCPPYAVEDIGKTGTLAVTFDGGSVSWDAILLSFEIEGSVGDLLRGSAEFAFTGES